MAKRKSSARWLQRQQQDPYVAKAQAAGYRSRAVYKLEELDLKYKLFDPCVAVVDLGAAPGAWTQYCLQKINPEKGFVIAVDILPMQSLTGASIIEGDFTEQEALDSVVQSLNGRSLNLVLSDMAPNISGTKAIDQPKSMYLAELAMEFAFEHLSVDGNFVVKLFQGQGYAEYIKELRTRFSHVASVKPKASRKESSEMYAVARGFRV